MDIGERIRQRRIDLNMTQDELAKKVGYKSRSSIQKIESARDLPLKKVNAMAKALGCKPAYLMGWDETLQSFASYSGDIGSSDIDNIIRHLDNENKHLDNEQTERPNFELERLASSAKQYRVVVSKEKNYEVVIDACNKMSSPELERLKTYIDALLSLRTGT